MGGLAIPPRQDDPSEQPARLERRSDLEEALEADSLLIASAGDLGFGIEAAARAHSLLRRMPMSRGYRRWLPLRGSPDWRSSRLPSRGHRIRGGLPEPKQALRE